MLETFVRAGSKKKKVCFLILLCLSVFNIETRSQSISEIPIERCDLLPVVRVRIDNTEMLFLLDPGAPSMLNLKPFPSGRSKEVQFSSWSGTTATSAREVFLSELLLGDHKLRDIRLPAIDLSPIGTACGGK